MNPDLIPFLERWEQEWSSLKPGATPADRRAHFEIVARNMRLPTPDDVDCDAEHWVDSPAGEVRCRVFRHGSDVVQPCLVYMHGGAWMQGSPETHWDITSRIASWNRQTVISVDYAKSPERPFPAALDQVIAVLRWANKQAAELGVDPTQIAVGGDSAGANLAAAAAIDLRGELPILAQLLVYPPCDGDRTRPSYRENPDGPMIRPDGKVEELYAPNPEDRSTHRVWPLLADDHTNLPPAYIAVGEFDPLRDSGVAYAEALEAAGVPVVLDRGAGLIHGYLRAMAYCRECEERLKSMAAWLHSRNAR